MMFDEKSEYEDASTCSADRCLGHRDDWETNDDKRAAVIEVTCGSALSSCHSSPKRTFGNGQNLKVYRNLHLSQWNTKVERRSATQLKQFIWSRYNQGLAERDGLAQIDGSLIGESRAPRVLPEAEAATPGRMAMISASASERDPPYTTVTLKRLSPRKGLTRRMQNFKN
jgi:hypothetical protein